MTTFRYGTIKRFMRFCLLAIATTALLSGCGGGSAVNRTENYSYAWPSISYSLTCDITVGVIDKRPYVTSGKIPESYVGLMRGGFGNPWYMHTESGKPLASDISLAVASGLMNAGANTNSIVLSSNTSQQDIIDKFTSRKSKRKILIKIFEWKSDTFRTTKFLYDVSIEVYDSEGRMITSHSEENVSRTDENRSAISPVDAGRDVLSLLLNNKSVESALKI